MPPPPPSPAFTLIELVVVIGIVAVLVSITIPALATARQTSQRIKCLANLRSLGQGLQNYMNDSKDRLPFVRPLHEPGGNQNNPSLLDVMVQYLSIQAPAHSDPNDTASPYINVADIFRCPSDRVGKDPTTAYMPVWQSSGTSYEYFAGEAMLGALQAFVKDPALAVTLTYQMPRWQTLPVIVDYDDWHPLRAKANSVPRNALYFGDWHVDWSTPILKLDDKSAIVTDLICDIVKRNGGVPLPGCN